MHSDPKASILEELVIDGLRDYTYVAWVQQMVRDRYQLTDPQDRRTIAIGAITEALVAGIMVPGDVTSSDGPSEFVAWDCTVGDAVERITREWQSEWGLEVPTPGAIVWLENTAAGNELARAALARKEA